MKFPSPYVELIRTFNPVVITHAAHSNSMTMKYSSSSNVLSKMLAYSKISCYQSWYRQWFSGRQFPPNNSQTFAQHLPDKQVSQQSSFPACPFPPPQKNKHLTEQENWPGNNNVSICVFSDLLDHFSFFADDPTAVAIIRQYLQHHLTSTHISQVSRNKLFTSLVQSSTSFQTHAVTTSTTKQTKHENPCQGLCFIWVL